MDKGIVMEVYDKYIVVLSDGEFKKLNKKTGVSVGADILFNGEDVYKDRGLAVGYRSFVSAAVASVAVVLMLTLIYTNNFMVFAVVTLDINPSVEIRLNRQNEVLSVEAMNDDGLELLDVDTRGKDIDEAISMLVDEAVVEGFVDAEADEYVVITTIPVRSNEHNNEVIQSQIEMRVNEDKVLQNVNIAILESSVDEFDEAVEKEVPVGLVAIGDDVDLGDVETVKEFFEDEENVRVFEKKNRVIYKYTTDDGQKVEVEVAEDDGETIVSVDVKTNNGLALGKDKDSEDDDIEDSSVEEFDDGSDNEADDGKSNNGKALGKDKDDVEDDSADDGDIDDLDSDDDFDDDVDDHDEEEHGDNKESLVNFVEKLEDIGSEDEVIIEFIKRANAALEADLEDYKELKDEGKALWQAYKDEWKDAVRDRDRLSEEDDEEDGDRSRYGEGADDDYDDELDDEDDDSDDDEDDDDERGHYGQDGSDD